MQRNIDVLYFPVVVNGKHQILQVYVCNTVIVA